MFSAIDQLLHATTAHRHRQRLATPHHVLTPTNPPDRRYGTYGEVNMENAYTRRGKLRRQGSLAAERIYLDASLYTDISEGGKYGLQRQPNKSKPLGVYERRPVDRL